MEFNELDHSVKRAYMIALAGGFKICLAGNISLRDTLQEAKSLLPGATFTAPTECDLLVEVSNFHPDYRRANKGQTIEEIHQQIVEKSNLPDFDAMAAGGAIPHLLKTACNKLNFTPIDVDKVNRVSRVIAELEKAEEVKIEHVAEAIHYQVEIAKPVPGEHVYLQIQENQVAAYPPGDVIQAGDIFLAKFEVDNLYTT